MEPSSESTRPDCPPPINLPNFLASRQLRQNVPKQVSSARSHGLSLDWLSIQKCLVRLPIVLGYACDYLLYRHVVPLVYIYCHYVCKKVEANCRKSCDVYQFVCAFIKFVIKV